MNEHRVTYELDADGNWLVRAPDIPGCHSYGRSLSEARKNMQEALSLFLEDHEAAAMIEVQRLPRAARDAVAACRRARKQAQIASDNAMESTSITVRFLNKEIGLGVRDIGELLGLSHQRIAQLLSDEAA